MATDISDSRTSSPIPPFDHWRNGLDRLSVCEVAVVTPPNPTTDGVGVCGGGDAGGRLCGGKGRGLQWEEEEIVEKIDEK